MKTVEVVAAIVIHEGKILCAQRNISKLNYISKKFEFPGGKIEQGETHIQALARELSEELQMNVHIDKHFMTVNHSYPDFNLTMHSFLCFSKTKELILKEHLQALWLTIDQLDSLDWAAADIPIVNKIKEQL